MKSRNKSIGFGLMLLLAINTISAQDSTQAINLETILQLGGANNLTIQKYKQKQELALADLDKAREWWLPDIYAGTIINQLWGTTMNSDGLFYTDVNSQNFWAGIGLNASWDFGKGIFNAKAENLKAQSIVHLTIAERNNALLEIIHVYYDFLSTQLHYMAYQQLEAQSDIITEQIGVQVKAGIRYESEYLVALSNQSLLKVEIMNAKMKYSIKSAALARLLNLSPKVKLVITDTLLTPLDLVSQLRDVVVIDSIYSNRPEFNASTLMLKSLQTKKRTTTIGLWLPNLRLGTYTSMFGDVFSPTYTTSAINASLIWKIPLGRLIYKGELAQFNTKIAMQETEIEEIKAMVNEEVVRAQEIMNIVRDQIEIARQGSEFAKKALLQSMQRQQFGTVLPFEIFQTQELYIKARLDYLDAVSNYNKAQYQLFVAMGNKL